MNVEVDNGDDLEELPTSVEGKSSRCAEKWPIEPVHSGGKKEERRLP